jgi:hypothetical protein
MAFSQHQISHFAAIFLLLASNILAASNGTVVPLKSSAYGLVSKSSTAAEATGKLSWSSCAQLLHCEDLS